MATTYLSYTQGTPTNNKKWTWSGWIKLGGLDIGTRYIMSAYDDANNNTNIRFLDTTGRLDFQNYVSSSDAGRLKTTMYLKDPSAWYNIVCIFDSDNVTSGDRQQIWINGVRQTVFDTETYPSSGAVSIMNADTRVAEIGRRSDGTDMWNGNMAHVHFCDGQAYAASNFGSFDATSGIWVANSSPSVTYGNNGYFMKFASGATGTDSSGEGNNMTVTGTLTTTKDNPDNNFNCPNQNQNRSGMTYLNGGTTMKGVADSTTRGGFCNFALNSGKWYYELRFGDTISGEATVGICDQDVVPQRTGANINPFSTDSLRSYGYRSGGNKITAGTSAAYGNTYADGDDIGCAMDLDAGNIWFSKNGTWQNSATIAEIAAGTTTNAAYSSMVTGKYYVVAQMYENLLKTYYNFGQGSFSGTAFSGTTYQDSNGEGIFKYEVPSGFLAICTANIKANS